MNPSNQKGQDFVKDKGLIAENLEGIGGIKDSYAKEYVFKKTDRIVAALYAVTRHLKDNEPAKGSLREGAVELVRLITALNLAEEEIGVLRGRVGATALRMVTLLEALAESLLISRANCAILRKELLLFVRFLATMGTGSPLHLDTQTFVVPLLKRGKRGGVRSVARGEILDKVGVKDNRQGEQVHEGEVKEVAQVKDKNENTDRTQAIISLLKTKSDLMVKDFLAVLPGISEKTIQRELSAMVARGTIKKTGLRRWTRYSIVG